MSDGARIPPFAIEAWRRVCELQTGDPESPALRDALAELRRVLGIGLEIEPHRATDRPWSWIAEDYQYRRWQLSLQLRLALDAALWRKPHERRRRGVTEVLKFEECSCRVAS